MGGFYERFVGLIKNCLKKAIGRSCLNFTELDTVLSEIEFVINNRPYLKINDCNQEMLVTPNHFLSHNRKEPLFLNESVDSDDPDFLPKLNPAESLILKWKVSQNKLIKFWELWQNQYLQSLLENRNQSIHQPFLKSNLIPKIGEIVLVKTDSNRVNWLTGSIVELIKSKDELIRAAKVRLASGKCVTRAIAQLHPLEL
jgi:hypothetical protein